MHTFLSEEWINAYKDEWNTNEKLKKGLRGFNASIKYYVEGSGDAVHLFVEDGEATAGGPADRESYDFEMWAKLDHWKDLASGGMGPRAAMLTKRLKFKGSMVTAMKFMGPFEDSLRLMGTVPTRWD